jgi:16S rRNA (uracil1498-N3)-methyltransferase
VVVTVTGRYEEAAPPAPVTLAVGLTKKGFDDLIRQAVELGVERVVPLLTARTVKGLGSKHDRWRRIACEAAKPSGRAHAIHISEVTLLREYAAGTRSGAGFVGELEAPASLLEASVACRPPYSVVIGPEGGLTPEEGGWLREAGFRAVTLGPGVLRTETAAVAAGAILCAAARQVTRALDRNGDEPESGARPLTGRP